MNKGVANPLSVTVAVAADIDVVSARRQGRILAEQLGFSVSEATLVATAISELARNIVLYAGNGQITVGRIDGDGRCGITIVATDRGPGIADTALATNAGYSTSGGLGLGLPGVRRIMDEFQIESEPGRGTTVKVIKWQRH